jgi:hypothetical protein
MNKSNPQEMLNRNIVQGHLPEINIQQALAGWATDYKTWYHSYEPQSKKFSMQSKHL